jgi:hypothetical protein
VAEDASAGHKVVMRVSLASLLFLAAVACGGRLASEGSGGSTASSKVTPSDDTADGGATPSSGDDSTGTGSGSGSGSGASSGGDPFPVCPDVAPSAGAACPNKGQGCAFVDFDTGTCVSFTCDSNGHWQTSTPAGC